MITLPELCMDCEKRPVSDECEYGELCAHCLKEAELRRAELYWERRQEGECFRGAEAAAFEAEQQAHIQREFK